MLPLPHTMIAVLILAETVTLHGRFSVNGSPSSPGDAAHPLVPLWGPLSSEVPAVGMPGPHARRRNPPPEASRA